MRTYSADEVMDRRWESAECRRYVDADVARGLYAAAEKALASMPIAGESERQDEARWALMDALAAADGEEV